MSNVFTARQDRGDGLDLRTLGYGGEEVSARLYFALRDEWWRTVPLEVLSLRREATATGFVVEIDAVAGWESHPADVAIRYVADGSELLAEYAATARGAFTYCRIGFCLLLPVDGFRGRPATSWRSDVATDLEFPTAIVTRDQLDSVSVRFHRPFGRLETTLASGTRVRYIFDGEEFEFEDQRNWTDASYKAYSTRPSGSWPLSTVDRMRFSQQVRIQVEPSILEPILPVRNDFMIRIGGPIGIVPSIGHFRGRLSPRSFRPGGGFQELNARRPDAAQLDAHDSIELAVNGAVHAADDDSVLETTAVHGAIVAQARFLHPDLPVRLAPISFLDTPGDWRDEAGHYHPEPPKGPVASRLRSEFAATWAIASAARAVPAAPDMLRYFDTSLSEDSPAGRAVARLASLSGREVLAVSAPSPLAALAVVIDGTVTLAVANPSPDAKLLRLPDGQDVTLDGFASAWFQLSRETAIAPTGNGRVDASVLVEQPQPRAASRDSSSS